MNRYWIDIVKIFTLIMIMRFLLNHLMTIMILKECLEFIDDQKICNVLINAHVLFSSRSQFAIEEQHYHRSNFCDDSFELMIRSNVLTYAQNNMFNKTEHLNESNPFECTYKKFV